MRWWPTAPLGGTSAPTLAEGSTVGEPTGTVIDDHDRQWRGRCCHKRRFEYRLMVRRRDPRGSRRVAREFGRTFESMWVKIKNIAACLRASRKYQNLI